MKQIIRTCCLCVVFSLIFINVSFSCGPEFDDAYLVRGSKESFLSIPEGYFLYELEKIIGYKKKPASKVDVLENTADSDVLELEKALMKMNISKDKKNKAVASYADARSQILHMLKSFPFERKWGWYGGSFRNHESGESTYFGLRSDFKFANEIPIEFVLYLKGAIEYHSNEFKTAIKIWEQLLKLPEDKRRYRSVWASYMIGKAYLSMRKSKESIDYFEKTRNFSAKGYKDSLDLAHESYGWQALAEYEDEDYISSIRHYLEKLDAISLSWVCKRVFELDEAEFIDIAKDGIARKVLIAWTVSNPAWSYWSGDRLNKDIYDKLLAAIEKIGEDTNIHNADRIAWAFYNNGEFDSAKKFIKLADEDSPLARWIHSKLLLREGKIDESITELKLLIPLFEKNQEGKMFYKTDESEVKRMVSSEIGLLQLRRQDYIAAFETLIIGGAYWEDIAYVAEKVLTTKELEEYLAHNKNKLTAKVEWYYSSNLDEPTFDNALRYLLARRFARDKVWGKAISYMPISFTRYWYDDGRKYETFSPKEKLEKLCILLEKAQNKKLPNQQRAKSYYKAALLMREYGMELVGTELDPDWFVFNGQFAYDATTEQRFGVMQEDRKEYYKDWYDERIEEAERIRKEIVKKRNFFTGSKNEEKRVFSSLPNPAKRFHYRFKAADLMWMSAELLPDNDQLKAKALCVGGSYIKIKDPNGALKFWKELVNTCSETELGKEAKKLGWFPKNIKE